METKSSSFPTYIIFICIITNLPLIINIQLFALLFNVIIVWNESYLNNLSFIFYK